MGASGLGSLLVEDGLLSENDRRTISRSSGTQGSAFARSIVAMGLMDEDELATFLAGHTSFRVASKNLLDDSDKSAIAAIDPPLLARLEVLPLRLTGRTLTVAVADPLDRDTLQQLEFFTGFKIRPVIATFSQIRSCLATMIKDYRPLSGRLEDFLSNHANAATRRQKLARAPIPPAGTHEPHLAPHRAVPAPQKPRHAGADSPPDAGYTARGESHGRAAPAPASLPNSPDPEAGGDAAEHFDDLGGTDDIVSFASGSDDAEFNEVAPEPPKVAATPPASAKSNIEQLEDFDIDSDLDMSGDLDSLFGGGDAQAGSDPFAGADAAAAAAAEGTAALDDGSGLDDALGGFDGGNAALVQATDEIPPPLVGPASDDLGELGTDVDAQLDAENSAELADAIDEVAAPFAGTGSDARGGLGSDDDALLANQTKAALAGAAVSIHAPLVGTGSDELGEHDTGADELLDSEGGALADSAGDINSDELGEFSSNDDRLLDTEGGALADSAGGIQTPLAATGSDELDELSSDDELFANSATLADATAGAQTPLAATGSDELDELGSDDELFANSATLADATDGAQTPLATTGSDELDELGSDDELFASSATLADATAGAQTPLAATGSDELDELGSDDELFASSATLADATGSDELDELGSDDELFANSATLADATAGAQTPLAATGSDELDELGSDDELFANSATLADATAGAQTPLATTGSDELDELGSDDELFASSATLADATDGAQTPLAATGSDELDELGSDDELFANSATLADATDGAQTPLAATGSDELDELGSDDELFANSATLADATAGAQTPLAATGSDELGELGSDDELFANSATLADATDGAQTPLAGTGGDKLGELGAVADELLDIEDSAELADSTDGMKSQLASTASAELDKFSNEDDEVGANSATLVDSAGSIGAQRTGTGSDEAVERGTEADALVDTKIDAELAGLNDGIQATLTHKDDDDLSEFSNDDDPRFASNAQGADSADGATAPRGATNRDQLGKHATAGDESLDTKTLEAISTSSAVLVVGGNTDQPGMPLASAPGPTIGIAPLAANGAGRMLVSEPHPRIEGAADSDAGSSAPPDRRPGTARRRHSDDLDRLGLDQARWAEDVIGQREPMIEPLPADDFRHGPLVLDGIGKGRAPASVPAASQGVKTPGPGSRIPRQESDELQDFSRIFAKTPPPADDDALNAQPAAGDGLKAPMARSRQRDAVPDDNDPLAEALMALKDEPENFAAANNRALLAMSLAAGTQEAARLAVPALVAKGFGHGLFFALPAKGVPRPFCRWHRAGDDIAIELKNLDAYASAGLLAPLQGHGPGWAEIDTQKHATGPLPDWPQGSKLWACVVPSGSGARLAAIVSLDARAAGDAARQDEALRVIRSLARVC